MTEHRNIIDSELHEVKGAATATLGQLLSANGSGGSVFINQSDLNTVGIESVIESGNSSSQNPAGTDTATQVSFGAGGTNSDVSISAGGDINILSDGLYSITINLNFGRTGTSGVAILAARLLLNSAAIGFTQSAVIDTSANTVPFNANILRAFEAGDVLEVEYLRDSNGTNDGGLIITDPVLAGWATSPSAFVRVQKLAGGY